MKNILRSFLRFNKVVFVVSVIVLCGFASSLHAQIDTVIVEKYYISDANDATDTTAADTTSFGNLPIGSVTYRIYIDLADSCRLKKIYGDANHALKFLSDSVFFNNRSEGVSFGNDLNKSRFRSDPTVALDTWLTLDHATKDRSGILKTADTNIVSLLGGNGSGGLWHPGGYLNNTDPQAGIPVSVADGLTTAATIGLSSGGDLNFMFSSDSTIFGKLVSDSQFVSNDAFLQHSGNGLQGPNPENRILIAQLTTRGDLRFEINVIVEEKIGPIVTTYTIVANNNIGSEVTSPYLTYPPVCGCTDIKYLEYNPLAPCLEFDSCKTLKVFGCTDTMACNFDPTANILLPGFCCYPGSCQDRDLSLACPNLSERLSIFPNPVQHVLGFEIYSPGDYDTYYEMYDVFGRVVVRKALGKISGTVTEYTDVYQLEKGVYYLRIFVGDTYYRKTFIKN